MRDDLLEINHNFDKIRYRFPLISYFSKYHSISERNEEILIFVENGSLQ